jgi:serine protease Do
MILKFMGQINGNFFGAVNLLWMKRKMKRFLVNAGAAMYGATMRKVLIVLAMLCGAAGLNAADTLQLKEQGAITGTILAEKAEMVVIDVGYTVLLVPRPEIVNILKAGNGNGGEAIAPVGASISEPLEAVPALHKFFHLAPSERAERSVRELASELGESVVQVRTPKGLGSGFILNEDGFLITNFHVIEGETQISIEVYHQHNGQLERKSYKDVRIIAMNKFKDLALLRIEDAGAPKFKRVFLGDSDALSVGERVFAIGSPLGLERTVTEGILSTKTRQLQGELYLQTSAQINPGNSGGPLFNMRGEVVGVTNMKMTFGEGLGFAIPIEAVKFFLNNRDAYAYDHDNPSNAFRYLEPPQPDAAGGFRVASEKLMAEAGRRFPFFERKNMLKKIVGYCLLGSILALPFRASASAPEQLLPADTIAVFTVPDWIKAASYHTESPLGKLWNEPALRPFKENFLKQFRAEMLAPLERELGVKAGDYADLIQGQLTVAYVGDRENSGSKNGLVFILDARDKKEELSARLAELKRKWVDSGKQIKTEEVRGAEITTIRFAKSDLTRSLQRVFGEGEEGEEPTGETNSGEEEKEETLEVHVGISGSHLLVANKMSPLEKVLARQGGAQIAGLLENPQFQSNYQARFRDALAFGWVHFQPVYEAILRQANQAEEPQEPPMMVSPDRVLSALGLGKVEALALSLNGDREGSFVEMFVGLPENQREGLLRLFAPEAKEATPPPFIPADAVKFSRYRIDGQKAWSTVESMLTRISPEMGGLLQFLLANAGKDQDPNFDLKRSLIGNLGDDFIVFEKKPGSLNAEDLQDPPSLFLVGSPNPENLAAALKTAVSILPLVIPGVEVNERPFLGRKLYSVPLATTQLDPDAEPINKSFHFAASASYLASSTDLPLLEEFLRGDQSGQTLRETAGLTEAAQKVGGMSTGFFGFENQRETVRINVEALKQAGSGLDGLMMFGAGQLSGRDLDSEVKEWLDFSLLPEAEAIARYFTFVVYSGTATAEGISWKFYSPVPRNLR